MSTIQNRGGNPQGLATFDPMKHPNYRNAMQQISDRYQRQKGRAPIGTPEERLRADRKCIDNDRKSPGNANTQPASDR